MTIYTLYVKTHRKTGLKYLGQTSQDPFKYPGSGVDWELHLKKFGNDVHTEILLQTIDKEERNKQGRYFSKLWHVVTSMDDYGNKIWANKIPETGGGGDTSKSDGFQKYLAKGDFLVGEKNGMYGKSNQEFMTPEDILKMKANQSSSGKGRKQSEDHIKKRMESLAKSGKNKGRVPWNKDKPGLQIQSEETRKKKMKPVVFRGVKYDSAAIAAEIHNTTYYYIMKEINGTVTSCTRKCTTRQRATSK